MNHPDPPAVIASWLSGRGGVFGPPYDDDAEGLIHALYRAGYVIRVNHGEGEIVSTRPEPERPVAHAAVPHPHGTRRRLLPWLRRRPEGG